jgi:hypothetical protein
VPIAAITVPAFCTGLCDEDARRAHESALGDNGMRLLVGGVTGDCRWTKRVCNGGRGGPSLAKESDQFVHGPLRTRAVRDCSLDPVTMKLPNGRRPVESVDACFAGQVRMYFQMKVVYRAGDVMQDQPRLNVISCLQQRGGGSPAPPTAGDRGHRTTRVSRSFLDVQLDSAALSLDRSV